MTKHHDSVYRVLVALNAVPQPKQICLHSAVGFYAAKFVRTLYAEKNKKNLLAHEEGIFRSPLLIEDVILTFPIFAKF